MSDSTEVHAQIGEVKIGRHGQTLHALLGSCIGIGFLWPGKGVFGLAHCLLSQSPKLTDEIGARHVDQAVQSLVRLMGIEPADQRSLQVILAGGGNMTMADSTPDARLVGSINATFARKHLKHSGFRIMHQDLGGSMARRVSIDCTTGEFIIKQIPRLGAALC
jgi:chemotaxis protein CheD